MSKFKVLLMAGSFVLAAGLSPSPMVVAQDLRVDDGFRPGQRVKDQPSVVIHKGIVLGISRSAVLSFDPQTGSIEVRYRDGTRFDGVVATSAPAAASATMVWVDAGIEADGGVRAKELCGLQATTLQNAIALVQSACANGPSNTCAGAQESLANAYSDYQACLRNALK